ncbi:MAG: AAA family ATPase [Deltaproteobacteria bacterium]|nr:AAA family ATPase [Deltaproteobacteria bacterium]
MRDASSRLRAPESRRFQIGRRLGAGGMGVVWEAFDRERGEQVALKTLPRLEADALLRLKNEFHGLLDLHHPNLIDLGDLVAEGQQWFFTMELVDGCDFLEWVRRSDDRTSAPTLAPSIDTIVSERPVAAGAVNDAAFAERVFQHLAVPSSAAPPDLARLRSALSQLASGLSALHDARKIHRDVKPSNVLVTRGGRLVLLDFGLLLDLVGTRATPEQALVGTVDYMAPEQAGSREVGPAADWYAVGVMLFEALTGHLPFRGTPVEVLVAKQLREPPRPSHVAPGIPDDLDRLTVDLLRRLPEARPPGWEVLRRLGTAEVSDVRLVPAGEPSRPSFVGRGDELSALRAGLDDVRRGRGRVVCVAGPSGVGKTTLVRKLLQSVRDTAPEAVVLAGRCYERDSVPFKAVDGVVDALTHHLRSLKKQEVAALLPPDVALLPMLFPVLARIEPVSAAGTRRPTVADPQALRTRAFAALRTLLSSLAERRPLVVTIDDLQWADADSLALLSAVLAPPDAPPLYLVTTVRTETADDAARLLAALPPGAELVSLDSLRSEDATELARLLLATSGRDGVEASDIAREAHGHPLFIDELVRHLASGHTATRGLRLDDAIVARVVRLDAASRAVLEVVSSATRRPTLALVANATELTMGEVARCLSGLRAARLVRTSGTKRSDIVETYHDRVREAVCASLRPESAAFWHRRIALSLETAGDADAEALAFHWRHAGERERARRHAMRAADEAIAMLAFERAARLLATALELDPGDGPERARLLARRADALANAGRGPQAADAYLQAAGEAASAERVELLRLAAEQLLRSGYVDRGAALVREVVEAVGVGLPPTPRRALVSLLFHRARLRIRGLGWKEREPSTIAPSTLSRIDTCWSVGMGLGMVDTLRAADFQTRNVLLALESGEPRRIARALAFEAGFVSTAGGPAQARARQLLAQATALADRLDDPRVLGFVQATAGVVPYMAGRWSEALAAFDRAEEHLVNRCTGVTWELDSVRQFQLNALYCVGRLRELSRRVPELVRDAQQRGDLFAATNFRTGLPALVGLVADHPDATRGDVRDAMSLWSQHGFHAQHFYAMNSDVSTHLYEGDGEGALAEVLDRYRALEGSMLTRVQIVRLTALDLRARAYLAAALDTREPSRRADLLRRAEADTRAILREKMPWSTNLAELASAGIAWARGDTDGALRWIDRASSGFAADDAAVFGAVARWRRGELVGGAEGHALVSSAHAMLDAEGVKAPRRWVGMLAPWGPSFAR